MFPVVICKCVFPTDVPWKHSSYSSQPGSWRWIPLLHRSTTVLSADGYPEVRYIFMIHPVKNNDKDYTSFSQVIILYIYTDFIYFMILYLLCIWLYITYIVKNWLVVWNMAFIFPNQIGDDDPIWLINIFQGGWNRQICHIDGFWWFLWGKMTDGFCWLDMSLDCHNIVFLKIH
jgi:hypothetical protein